MEVGNMADTGLNEEEFNKLVDLLDQNGIPYDRADDELIKRIHYPQHEKFVCSAVFGHGTYGSERGLIEIMGLLTPEEEAYCGGVMGGLTADEVFKRIKIHYTLWEEANKRYIERMREIKERAKYLTDPPEPITKKGE